MPKNYSQPAFSHRKKNPITGMLSNKNFFMLSYKLLHDGLYILFFAFTAILISESLLPGIVTSHLSLTKLTITLLTILVGTIAVGKKLEMNFSRVRLIKTKLLPILIIFSFLLIGNSLLKFELWENIIITILTLFSLALFYYLFFSEKD